MSQKTFKSTENKRAVDLGKVTTGLTSDLIKVWRTTTGEEKAISLGDINAGLIGDYVPYTGAVDDVDLGEKGISAGYVKYDTTPTSTPTDQGTTYWDIDDNTLAVIMNGTTLKVGEDQYYPVKNQTGVLIPKGTAVRFAGTLGSSGRLLIAPFLADGSLPSSRFMGITSEDIANGADGKVMWFGRIRGLNTNAFNEGDILYASTTVSGGFQTTVPEAPNNIVQVCAVINKSTTQGIIFVRPTLGSNINKDEGVKLTSLANKDLLQYQSDTGLWENKSVASIILSQPLTGYTVGANTALADTDTILQAFGKVQGQINARISGTIASGQVAFGTGVNTVGGSNSLFWDSVNNRLGVGTNNPSVRLQVNNGSAGGVIRAVGLSNFTEIGTTAIDIGLLRTSSVNGIEFQVNSTTRSFTATSLGIDLGVGRTIYGENNNVLSFQNSSGNIYLGTTNANRHVTFGTNNIERARITDTFFGLYTTSPTNTLDVNGTARIRTISNLGSAATSVLVPSATGVVSLRTLAELSADMGNAWTSVGSGNIFRNSRISVGHTGDPVESIDLGTAGWLRVANGQNAGGGIIFPFSSSNANSRSWSIGSDHGSAFGQLILRRSDTQSGNPRTGTITLGIDRGGNVAINGSPFFNSNFTYFDVYGRSINESGVLRLFTSDSNRLFQTYINSGTCISETNSTTPWSFRIGTNEAFRIATSRNVLIGTAVDLGFRFYVAGTTAFQGLVTFQENVVTDIAFGTTIGSKIGTATDQRLAFWNKTPIVQPTNAIVAGAFVANTSGIANDTATYGGYTMGQIAQALINVGILA